MTSAVVSHLLDAIPFDLPRSTLFEQARVKIGSPLEEELLPLAAEGVRIARPKALYLVAYILDRGEDFVDIEHRRFTSRVLRVNLDKTYRVFPYLATCGMELQVWGDSFEDPLHRYWAEIVKHLALGAAMRALSAHIVEQYKPGEASTMNPGSLPDWPLEQQRVLFDLLGDGASQLGVQLTESLLMLPTKTVSGIRFPTSARFESCQLCPREHCPGRRAPFEPALAADGYGIASGD